MKQPIHHLHLAGRCCVLEAKLNGFPVAMVQAGNEFAPPINSHLIGSANLLELTLHDPSGKATRSDLATMEVDVSVRRYENGGIVEPGGGEEVVRLPLDAALREQARDEPVQLPLTISVRFDNDGPSFRKRIVNAPPLSNREALLDYAMKLRDIFAQQNMAAFIEEMAPKRQDYAAAAYISDDQLLAQMKRELPEAFAPGFKLDFDRHDIEVLSWCEGRVWELCRKPRQPLIESQSANDGEVYCFPIFVGETNAQLRVVR